MKRIIKLPRFMITMLLLALWTSFTYGAITIIDGLAPKNDAFDQLVQFENIGTTGGANYSLYYGVDGSGANLSQDVLNEILIGTANQYFRVNSGANGYEWDTLTKADVGLSNVENTALSTWVGSTNITTLGTIATGIWNGSAIAHEYGGLEADVSAYNGLLKISGGSTSSIPDNSAYWNTSGKSRLLVAANDAPAFVKAVADYTCDGSSDETEINQALTACGSAVGGEIRLSSGTFNVDGCILVPSNIILRGSGLGTVITQADDTDDLLISNSDRTNGNVNIRLIDMYIDGNKYGQGAEGLIPAKYPDEEATMLAVGLGSVDFLKVTDLIVANVTVVNGWWSCLEFRECVNVMIRSTVTKWSGDDGIAVNVECDQVSIVNNMSMHAGKDYKMRFDTGNGSDPTDEVITGGTSGAHTTIDSIHKDNGDEGLESGSWAGGDAVGWFYFNVTQDQYDQFDDDEVLSSTSCTAVADGGTKTNGGPTAFEVQDGSRNVVLSGNIAFNAQRSGIEVGTHSGYNSCYNIAVVGNTIKNCVSSINIEGQGGVFQEHVTITGNSIYNIVAGAADFAITLVDCKDITIGGNNIVTDSTAIRIYPGTEGSERTYEDIVITGNTMLVPGDGYNTRAAVAILDYTICDN
ncbi:hypothetical protein KAR91_41560, partial [Candidatus Pacearchaeota archaeon]|nr:hypothetical protein [Candidatus Pacearchaeota archaeon]